MAAVGGHVRVLADLVAEEPKAGGGVATVVEAVQAGVQDQVAVAGVGVRGGVSVGDVVLCLRLGFGEQPSPLLDAQGVLGAATRIDVVAVGVDGVRHEARRESTAGRGAVDLVSEDLVPVVRGGRGARRAQHPGGDIGIQFKCAENTGREPILELFQPQETTARRVLAHFACDLVPLVADPSTAFAGVTHGSRLSSRSA